ncbi:MAG: RecX family transcriptional regulator [Tannerella sp.]|jgi:regulatory protein|nr:RecX family transcriptional regulator [Tannerella sp.]
MKTEAEMLNVMARYCSQGEKCTFDVLKKVKNTGLPEDAAQRIIDRLVEEGFIDEKRFARSFVNDKFRFNQWGKIKIGYELKIRKISSENIEEALANINENEYADVLTNLLKSKIRTVKSAVPQALVATLLRYATSRGFETDITLKTIKRLIKNVDYE